MGCLDGHGCSAGGAECAGRQDELRQTVQESLLRVHQLETELAELRAGRDRDSGDHGAEVSGGPRPMLTRITGLG